MRWDIESIYVKTQILNHIIQYFFCSAAVVFIWFGAFVLAQY